MPGINCVIWSTSKIRDNIATVADIGVEWWLSTGMYEEIEKKE